MSDLEAATYSIANLVLMLTVLVLGLGLALGRSGLVPGAEKTAVAIAGFLFVLTGVAGLVLVLVSWHENRDE